MHKTYKTVITPFILKNLLDSLSDRFTEMRNIINARYIVLTTLPGHPPIESIQRWMFVTNLDITAHTSQRNKILFIQNLLRVFPVHFTSRNHLSKMHITVDPTVDPLSCEAEVNEIERVYWNNSITLSIARCGRTKGSIKTIMMVYKLYTSIGFSFYGAARGSRSRIGEEKISVYTLCVDENSMYSAYEVTGKLESIFFEVNDRDLIRALYDRYADKNDMQFHYIAGDIIAAYLMGFVMSEIYDFKPLPDPLAQWAERFLNAQAIIV